MKRFFITLLAVIVGGIILSILPLIFFIGLVASVSGGDAAPMVKNNSILIYDLSTTVSDISSESFTLTSLSSADIESGISLMQVIDNIDKAAADSNIKGIMLKGASLGCGNADMVEIREALVRFKSSGKFVYFFDSSLTQSSLYVASVADGIYIVPEGEVSIYGVCSESMFMKGLFDNLGVDMQIIRHGKFKSAVEPYMLKQMSEASKLQMQIIVDGVWKEMRTAIAEGRDISESVIDKYADNLSFDDPQTAVNVGLIDSLCYHDEFFYMLKTKLGLPKNESVPSINMSSYTKVFVDQGKPLFTDKKIAVVYAMGEIAEGSNTSDVQNIYSNDFCDQLRKAANDSTIKAIVLRVSSPGGSALASDIIWREVVQAKHKKPVVVSMGDYAASGGYYISCAADYIYAQPTTLTGSIGVFGVIPCMKKLTDNVGVTFDGVKSNENSQISAVSPLTEQQTDYLTKSVKRVYNTFTKRCADGRSKTQSYIDSIGEGRVWTGADALGLGLVDELGGLQDAIEKARTLADMSEYELVEFPKSKDLFESFMSKLQKGDESVLGEIILGDDYQMLERVRNRITKPSVNALMEYSVTIK
jgi:protease-4